MTTGQPPPPKTRSGEHPAVKQYRKKLDSVTEGAEEATAELEKKLEEALADLKTPVPPKPDPAKP